MNSACYVRKHVHVPLACSHVLIVIAKHAQNKNSLPHLHMQMWNPKRLPAMPVGRDQSWIKVTLLHSKVLFVALGLTWSWAILKLDFTGHNSHVSFSRNIRNSSRRVLQGYKEKWQEVSFCQLKTLFAIQLTEKINGLAKTVDQRRRLEQVMLRWVSKWPAARQAQCQQPCTKRQHQNNSCKHKVEVHH